MISNEYYPPTFYGNAGMYVCLLTDVFKMSDT